jgi:hypothetical protein
MKNEAAFLPFNAGLDRTSAFFITGPSRLAFFAKAGTSSFAPTAKGAEAIVSAPREDALKKSLLFIVEFYLFYPHPSTGRNISTGIGC